MKRLVNGAAIGGLAIGIALWSRAPVLAHHSFAVTYIEADTIEIEGDVVEFQYKNPTDNRVRLKRIERKSDGWKWQGNRGDTR